MPMPLRDIEAEALHLSLGQRGLLRSLEPGPQDSPENISRAWNEEIARRIGEMSAGRAEPISYEQVRAELRALIDAHGGR